MAILLRLLFGIIICGWVIRIIIAQSYTFLFRTISYKISLHILLSACKYRSEAVSLRPVWGTKWDTIWRRGIEYSTAAGSRNTETGNDSYQFLQLNRNVLSLSFKLLFFKLRPNLRPRDRNGIMILCWSDIKTMTKFKGDPRMEDKNNLKLIRLSLLLYTTINTLRPRQNGRHFAEDMFKCIFLNENVWIPLEISLKFVPKGSINNNPALF